LGWYILSMDKNRISKIRGKLVRRSSNLRKEVEIFNYRPKEKIFNIKWEFHKTDADDKPCVPHGHSLDGQYKLSIWDGSVYKINGGQLVRKGKADKSEMIKLVSNPEFLKFVNEARDWYQNEYPYKPLKPLANGEIAPQNSVQLKRSQRESKQETFVVEVPVRLHMRKSRHWRGFH